MKTIVIGSLNTDLVATGIKNFPKSGEHVYGKELIIGPGGKSRNIADMIARLTPNGNVAMVGRTVKDPYGLWRAPVDALVNAGVNTDYLVISEYEGKLPGVALIPVDVDGNNQIIVLPGVSDDFSPEDINKSSEVFEKVSKNNGMLVLTLECPIDTATHAVKLANQNGLKVIFDPGGIDADTNIDELIKSGIYLIKPNEHEAKILTGIDVVDFQSAKLAAVKLQERDVENILITKGKDGAYLFTKTDSLHIPVPNVESGDNKDETGCGDQATATLCAFIEEDLKRASEIAVLAGTLQFNRSGIQPIKSEEINKYLEDK